jgi:hypothetical protein
MSGKESAETQGGQVTVIHPAPPKIDLRDAHAIRRELGAVYRDMRAGSIETQEGTRLAYVLNMLRMAYETSVLEDRIEKLEQQPEKGR